MAGDENTSAPAAGTSRTGSAESQARTNRRRSTKVISEFCQKLDEIQDPVPDRENLPFSEVDRDLFYSSILAKLAEQCGDVGSSQTIEGFGQALRFHADKNLKELQHKSAIPGPVLGNSTDIDIKARDRGIYICDGESTDFATWMSRINNACYGLTAEKWLEVAARHATGRLLTVLMHWQRTIADGNKATPQEIINRCDLTFGRSLTPSQAEEQLRKMKFKPDEDVHLLTARISSIAAMATIELEEPEKTYSRERQSKNALMHACPYELRLELSRQIKERAAAGRVQYTFHELAREAHDLTTRGEFRLQHTPINQVQETRSSDEEDNEQVLNANFARKRFPRKNRFKNTEFRRSNYKYKKRNPRKTGNYPRNIRNVDEASEDDSGSETIQEIDVNESTDEEANDEIESDVVSEYEDACIYNIKTSKGVKRVFTGSLGVSYGECLKCGSPDHFMKGEGSERCPYKKDPLTSKCTKCGKGGHHAFKCHRKN